MDCRVISAFTRVFRRAMPSNDAEPGELTPSEAADIAKVVDIYVRALATQGFEERLAKLERGPAPANADA